MIDFRSIDNYSFSIDEMLNYALNYFDEEEINKFNKIIVLYNLDVYGVLFNYNNRYLFYKLAENGYMPFYMEYSDFKKIVNDAGSYTLCKGNNYATIIDRNNPCEYILSYKDGFVKYNYHDLSNDKLYTFFYRQGQVFSNNRNIIVDDYFDIPDGFCYQNTPKSLLSYGYLKKDISSINPLAVLADTDDILDFLKKYDYYKNVGFPDLKLYTKIKNSKDKYIPSSVMNFVFKNEDGYIKSLKDLNIEYRIPKSLIMFYNGSFEIENILDDIVTKYSELKKNVLTKK